MNDEDWDSGFGKSVAVYLNGLGIPGMDPRGQRITDDSFVLCFNAHHEPIEFLLPPDEFGPGWLPVLDTSTNTGHVEQESALPPNGKLAVEGRAMVLLQQTQQAE
jgi:glycogen operon protein